MAIDSTRSMKKLLKFLFGLLINVCILFVLVKAFSYSYDFTYQVFATYAADVTDARKVSVQIAQDETMLDVADALHDAGAIDNKYAFILKVRIGGYAGQIKPGTYEIAPSDTNIDIIELITGVSGSSEDASLSSDSGSTTGTGDEGHPETDSTEDTELSEGTEEDTSGEGDTEAEGEEMYIDE